jgi:hypothetical protein
MNKYCAILLIAILAFIGTGCGSGGDGSLYDLTGHYGGWITLTEKSYDVTHVFSLWGDLVQSGSRVTGTLECPLGLDFDFDFTLTDSTVIGTVDTAFGLLDINGTTDGVHISATVERVSGSTSIAVTDVDGVLELTKSG